jgi:hypothetical protein
MHNSKVADYQVHSHYEIDTRDREDHTFCGVMFDVACKPGVPLEYMEIDAIWVRGNLGELTVWKTPETFRGKHERQDQWDCAYEKRHSPSFRKFTKLPLDCSICLVPGTSVGLYVHSKRHSDDAIVYDNQKGNITHDNEYLQVLPGLAHLSVMPFSPQGFGWGAWRQRREFVGRISYGVRYLLWNPETHYHFNTGFQAVVIQMLLCQRREESIISRLGDDWFVVVATLIISTADFALCF